MAAKPSLLAGTKIGALTLGKFLSSDAFGEHYQGLAGINKTPVLVRVLSAEISGNSAEFAPIASELKRFAACKHPHLAQIMACQHVPSLGRWLIVSSLGPATALNQRLQQQDFSAADAFSLMQQALATLQYMHEQGFIHGNLQPANLFVNPAGKLKIVNFAIPLLFAPADKATAEYQAPEMAASEEYNVAGDVFALGVIFRKMIQAVGAAKFTPEIRRIAERMSTQLLEHRLGSMDAALMLLGNNSATGSTQGAQKAITRSFERTKTMQIQVDRELKKARWRERLPSPFSMILLAGVGYFTITKVMPLAQGKSLQEFAKSLISEVVPLAKKVSGIQKMEDTKRIVTATKQEAEAAMARKTAALDQIIDEDHATAKK